MGIFKGILLRDQESSGIKDFLHNFVPILVLYLHIQEGNIVSQNFKSYYISDKDRKRKFHIIKWKDDGAEQCWKYIV